MDDIDNQFYEDLIREDDLGLVLRGQLHIEHQLIELCSLFMPCADRCDWGSISYKAKVELAYGVGLSEELKDLFLKIGALRNGFAHNLDAAVDAKAILNLYNGLPTVIAGAIKECYRQQYKSELTAPSRMPARDLLVLILLCARQSAKAAIHLARERD